MFDALREIIEWEMRIGADSERTLDEVDALITPSSVSEEQKAALWLFAFSLLDRPTQRRLALAHLELVGS